MRIFIFLWVLFLYTAGYSNDSNPFNIASILKIGVGLNQLNDMQPFYKEITKILSFDATKQFNTTIKNESNDTINDVKALFDLTYTPKYFIKNKFLFSPSANISFSAITLEFLQSENGPGGWADGYISQYRQNTYLFRLLPEIGFILPHSSGGIILECKLFPGVGLGKSEITGEIDTTSLSEFVFSTTLSTGILIPLRKRGIGAHVNIGFDYNKIINGDRLIDKTYADYFTLSAEYPEETFSFYFAFNVSFVLKIESG